MIIYIFINIRIEIFYKNKLSPLAPQKNVFYAKMAARIISGSRSGKVLIYRRFKYQTNRERGDIIHWRCWKTECRAPLKTNTFDLEDENARIIVQN
jgi:hypothetical protein